MKIVQIDNFNRDCQREEFLNLGELNNEAAREIANVINLYCSGDSAPYYWRVVENNYAPCSGDPNE